MTKNYDLWERLLENHALVQQKKKHTFFVLIDRVPSISGDVTSLHVIVLDYG